MMKEIKLMKLTLKNFKGVKDFSLEVNGNDVSVYGDNATGKTTLYDAFLWLLFNKNSRNQAKFSIKTITPEGQEMNNLEHEVEASFLVDGQPLTLKKVLFEDWTQKRGALEKTFKGNTNDYFIDDVPTPEKQYNTAIKNLVDEEVFKLLTSPTYFNEQFKWEKRREILLEITGDLTDQEVIDANKTLQELTGILNGKKIEDHKKIIAAKKKKINDEIKSIPTRISEINNLLPAGNIDVPSIEKEIAGIEKEIDGHTAQISNIKNGSAIVGKQQELQQVALDLESIKRELEADSIEKANKVNAKIQEEQSNISILKRKKEDEEYQVKRNNEEFESIENKLVPLREEYSVLEASKFTHEIECVCPTCEQDLPADQVAVAKEKALTAFNLKKSHRLEEIQELGKAGAEKKAELLAQNKKLANTATSTQSEIDAKQIVIAKLEAELETLREDVKGARQDARYQENIQRQTKLNEEIKALQENAENAVVGIENEVATLRAKRSELNQQIAQQAHFESSIKRIAELEAKQEQLAKDFENVEKELFLVEEFTRIKVEMLDEKINSKFKYARFKLTHKQVDGTLVDVCETTYNGVPYGSGLNNAAKINVGLDIIQTLSEHYGFRVPVFIDNAEAVTRLTDMDAQVISLVVSEKDKQLRIETLTNDMKEAI
ncbi:AAA family ATPase [Sporosarcina sp. FSL K6-2383]|uniref:AAA family ATPase n=1 Tax=Sporosarcina sp. FSL K6-2383 TaxID=2921556 RepID=UPI00315A2E79